jgi:hypothetical protein
MTPTTPIRPSQETRSTRTTALGSEEKVKPADKSPLAVTSGQSSSQDSERVSSLKVNRPRSKSLISHFMKSLIQKRRGTFQARGYFTAQGQASRSR